MSRGYDQLAWVDYPETLTPISAANLNRMENGIANLYSDRNKLESNMAYVEDGDTSSRHYDIDAYLMHNGVFYKVTEEINIGDTLDYGLDGNITHVDISSQFGSGGGGSTGCVELTQAQYDALSEEAKMADVIYLITDSPDNYLDEVFGDFATVEPTSTASKAYEAGDYLVYGNKFYKVNTAIAQGDTIVPDTNVEKTTVADEFSNASNVDYSNTTSGLAATDVQSALDELNSKLIKSCSDTKTTDANGFWQMPIPSNFHVLLGIIINSRVSGEAFTSLTKVNFSFGIISVKITEWDGNAIANAQMNCTIYYL